MSCLCVCESPVKAEVAAAVYAGIPTPKLVYGSAEPVYINGTFVLSPLLVLAVELAVDIDNVSGWCWGLRVGMVDEQCFARG